MSQSVRTAGGGEKTAMFREIYEQPDAIIRTLDSYADDSGMKPGTLRVVREVLSPAQRIIIAASGSSRHAGLAGEVMFEELTGILVDVEYASEFAARDSSSLAGVAVIGISQSGETADTLAALRFARGHSAKTLVISNVEDSTMAREADASMPTAAGKEFAIPATKSFTTQLAVLYLIALAAGEENGRLNHAAVQRSCTALRVVAKLMERALPAWDRAMAEVAHEFAKSQTLMYLGRGIHYAIAREGALKLKESSYVPAEAYPAGELKHGPNALVSEGVPLVVIATQDEDNEGSRLRYGKTVQLLRDLDTQGSRVLIVASEGDEELARLGKRIVYVPKAPEHLLSLLEVVPLQLLALYCAVENGIDVDRPRNLVKAVVAE